MTRSSKLILLLACASFIAAGSRHHLLVAARVQHGLTATCGWDNAPPMIAFTTVALGGFRGLIADILWLRVSQLQEQGKYFEIVQLADTITKLQPRFSEVWIFHAWNMAFNVSFAYRSGADRWRWVQSGIRLLRDEGIRLNPQDARLYFELAWFYQHKIGGTTDPYHSYYKQQLAETFNNFLGPSPDVQLDRLADPDIQDRLEQEFRLDPERMRNLSRFYGSLDWRLPHSHALYWAFNGRAYADEQLARFGNRMLFTSAHGALDNGRLIVYPEYKIFMTAPNLDLIPAIGGMHERALKAFGRDVEVEQYQRFVAKAVVLLTTAGRVDHARRLYNRLKDIQDPAQPRRTFEETVFDRYFHKTSKLTRKVVEQGITDAQYRRMVWLAVGDEAYVRGLEQLSGILHAVYRSRFPDEARALASLAEIKERAVNRAYDELPAGFKELLNQRLGTMNEG